MSVEFNPPPGWPLPKGWTPPPHWVPDPSWPPAPEGWQFWVDAEPAAGAARPSRQVWPLVVLAVVLVAAAGAVSVAWALRGSGDGADRGDRPTAQAGASPAAPVPEASSAPKPAAAAPSQCTADATDDTGDTMLMYDDRGEYNRSDIVSLGIRCAENDLTVTMTFAPGVDMAVAGFAVLIDLDPDAGTQGGGACDGSGTEDRSIAVDGSARDDSWSLLDTTSCETPYPTIASGGSTTTGQSMSATVPFAFLGLRSGDTITLRAFSSTYLPPDLLDPGQDDIPDGPPLRIRIG